MQSFTRSILGFARRPGIGSASPHWWPPAHSRSSPLMALASADPIRDLDRLSRPWSMEKNRSKPFWCAPFTCATIKGTCTENMNQKVTNQVKATNDVNNQSPYTASGIIIPNILANSSHRDGAIYKNMRIKEDFGDVDLTDRSETPLEPVMNSKAKCWIHDSVDCAHVAQLVLQFFSLTLAECHISNGPIELYGYIAARDDRDCKLNYVFNHSRDDAIIVKQGSFIEMTGPKRVIEMGCPVLIEYDMRIKNDEEEDDLQLIDGAISDYEVGPFKPIKHRIAGKWGTVDMTFAYVEQAVTAIIEVCISDVLGGFNLSLSSFIYTMGNYEEIQLFHGTVDEARGFRRFVIAATWDTVMLLKFKLANNAERCCSFKAKPRGFARRKIRLDLASVSVKVTWSTLMF